MADYLLLTISKRSGFCQGCHFWTEAHRWHEWNLSSGHRMTYLAATTRVIWRPPDNYFAAARELFWWPSYNASGGRYIRFWGLDPSPPPPPPHWNFQNIHIREQHFKIFCNTKRYEGMDRGYASPPSRPLPPLPPLVSLLPLWSGARFAREFFSLSPSLPLFLSSPSSRPSSPSSRPFTLPSPAPSSPTSLLPCPPPKVFLYAHFKIFCLASLACYYESACSVTAVRRFCWLPRKYQGCASFIYFLHMYRTTVPLTCIPVHSHLC